MCGRSCSGVCRSHHSRASPDALEKAEHLTARRWRGQTETSSEPAAAAIEADQLWCCTISGPAGGAAAGGVIAPALVGGPSWFVHRLRLGCLGLSDSEGFRGKCCSDWTIVRISAERPSEDVAQTMGAAKVTT